MKRAALRQRGFTLTELMVVVVISGVLAVVAMRYFQQHMNSSKSVEALTMVQSIRAAEERYRGLNLTYLDVSRSNQWYPWDPAEPENRNKRRAFFAGDDDGAHPDNARWLSLNPTAPGPVSFGYRVNAGLPGGTMTEPAIDVDGLTWPDPANVRDVWYVIQAVADADGDGEVAFYLASSINGEVFVSSDGE